MTIKTLLKLTTLAGLLAWALPAHAGKFYNLDQKTSSATLRVGYEGADRTDSVFISSGATVVQSTSATATHKFFRLLNNAASEVLSMTQNGILTASSFVGNLTGNVTGNADTATSVSNGSVGQVLYQSASDITAKLPAMAAGGIITGNGTSAIPSTGTFTGTASQVTITRTNSNVVLSLPNPINVATSGNAGTATALAANGANCSAGNYPLGVDASGAVESCTAVSGAATVSTFTFITPGSTNSGNTLNICVTGSTVTATFATGTVDVIYAGAVRAADINGIKVGFLMDGAYMPVTNPVVPYSATYAVVKTYDSAGTGTNGSFAVYNLPITSGSHSFCLTLKGTGADGNQSVGNVSAGQESWPRFGVRQVP
jgi:hypothetical protein